MGHNARPERPDDLTEFETALIARKAATLVRRQLLPRSDREDVQQTLALALLAARKDFDGTRGKAEGFARTVVGRAGAKLVRARLAAKRDPRRVSSLEGALKARSGYGEPSVEPDDSVSLVEQQTNLSHNVAAILAELPEALRRVAEALKTMSAAEAARHLGVPRTTVNDRVRALRERFAERGLRDYFSGPSVTSRPDG